jgi:hypothetical protein
MSLVRPQRVSTGTAILDGWEMWCPGCRALHAVNTGRNGWFFDGSLTSPTFTPSLLVQYGSQRCHSFITNGVWQFLSDSTHELAGLTHPMQDIPEDVQ